MAFKKFQSFIDHLRMEQESLVLVVVLRFASPGKVIY
jgi:hypothetical protein